MKGVKDTISR